MANMLEKSFIIKLFVWAKIDNFSAIHFICAKCHSGAYFCQTTEQPAKQQRQQQQKQQGQMFGKFAAQLQDSRRKDSFRSHVSLSMPRH